MSRKAISTTIDEIVGYWSQHEYEGNLAVDWAEAKERCWRCGCESKLERCHIVPHSLEGKDTPSNFVLLCRRCHREAPNISDARLMWTWICATCVPFYDTYWIVRGVFEFEQMFGRLPFENLQTTEKSKSKVEKLFREELSNVTIHFGEGRINPSTIACVFARVEEKLIGRLPDSPKVQWGKNYAFRVVGIQSLSFDEMSG